MSSQWLETKRGIDPPTPRAPSASIDAIRSGGAGNRQSRFFCASISFRHGRCRNVNTKQLRYFITVATEGAFTRASAKLRVAQPALSRQIALLEGELGTPLLIRHRRGVGLTDAGAALLDRVRPVLFSLDCIQSEIMDYSAAPTGPLRIGCTPTLTSRTLVVGPALRILQRFPNVSMQIQEGVSHQLCRAVLSDELDAAIVSENLAEFLSSRPKRSSGSRSGSLGRSARRCTARRPLSSRYPGYR